VESGARVVNARALVPVRNTETGRVEFHIPDSVRTRYPAADGKNSKIVGNPSEAAILIPANGAPPPNVGVTVGGVTTPITVIQMK